MESAILIELMTKSFTATLLPIIISSNLTAILVNKIKLYRLSKYNGSIISECQPLIKFSSSEIKQKIDAEKIEFLKPIIEKLKNYTSEENLLTAYNNLQNIKVKRKPLLIIFGITGAYNVKTNSISYSLSNSIGHEFLHLASAYYEKKSKVIFGGFCQRKGMASIGDGINEGYTELLASRIYNKNGKPKSYESRVKVAKLIEFFFDEPKDMESLYFNFNLPGLIHHLEQFAKREDIIKLLLDIDNMHYSSFAIFNPLPSYLSIKIQLMLYNWFAAHNKNPEKLKQFKELVCESKFASMIIGMQKWKLYRTNPFDSKKQAISPVIVSTPIDNSSQPAYTQNIVNSNAPLDYIPRHGAKR